MTIEDKGALAAGSHALLRVNAGVLVVQPDKVRILDADGLNDAAIPTPGVVTGVVSQDGRLPEGEYEYSYAYLLRGGDESVPSPVATFRIPSKDGRVTLTFPANSAHPKLFRKLVFRKGPGDGIPL